MSSFPPPCSLPLRRRLIAMCSLVSPFISASSTCHLACGPSNPSPCLSAPAARRFRSHQQVSLHGGHGFPHQGREHWRWVGIHQPSVLLYSSFMCVWMCVAVECVLPQCICVFACRFSLWGPIDTHYWSRMLGLSSSLAHRSANHN